MMTILFGTGLTLAIIVSTTIYVFAAPLLVPGSRAAKWEFWSWVAAIVATIVLGVVAALRPSAPDQKAASVIEQGPARRGTHMGDPADQERFKAALARAGVPYTLETHDGKEFVMWTQDQHAAAEKIQAEVLSGPLPNGRNIHFGDAATEKEFKDWLTKQGIAYRIVNVRGQNFVVWDGPAGLWKKFLDEHPGCPKAAMKAQAPSC